MLARRQRVPGLWAASCCCPASRSPKSAVVQQHGAPRVLGGLTSIVLLPGAREGILEPGQAWGQIPGLGSWALGHRDTRRGSQTDSTEGRPQLASCPAVSSSCPATRCRLSSVLSDPGQGAGAGAGPMTGSTLHVPGPGCRARTVSLSSWGLALLSGVIQKLPQHPRPPGAGPSEWLCTECFGDLDTPPHSRTRSAWQAEGKARSTHTACFSAVWPGLWEALLPQSPVRRPWASGPGAVPSSPPAPHTACGDGAGAAWK